MKPDSQPPDPAARIPRQDEPALVARVLAGDRAAFGALAQRYAGVARRVARAVLSDPDDADDAAQDALLSALVKVAQYDPRRPFDHRPDPVLGAALRRALEPEGEAAFLARLLARVDEVRLAATWDAVLARWARLGVVAAAVVALAAGYFVGRATAASTRQTVAEALLAPRTQAPVVEIVLASVLGN